MIRVSYGEVFEGRQLIADGIFKIKNQRQFSVIDVGGSAIGWSIPFADAFIDINKCDTNRYQYNFDICKEQNWSEVLKDIDKVGKFDYCICTHTLEDIYNPYLVLDYLPRIAKAGIITVPSVKTETNFIESEHWLGFAHHRYLFGHNEDRMIVAPKLPVIEKLGNRKKLTSVEEIRIEWNDTIEYDVFMNNYLGPNTDTVLKNYEQFVGAQQ